LEVKLLKWQKHSTKNLGKLGSNFYRRQSSKQWFRWSWKRKSKI
jgi:hypothetical protein